MQSIYHLHEGVCHLSIGSGLQPLDNQHFGLRVKLSHEVRGQVAVDVKVWCTGVLFIHTQELIDWSQVKLGLGASYDKATRLLSLQKLTQWALPSCER